MVKASRKRHRSDSNAEKKTHADATVDHKGRGMSKPANGLELYTYAYRRSATERDREEYVVLGHGPREMGARPFYEIYSVRYNGRLVAVEETRSAAGESARALRNGLPGGRFENLDEEGKRTLVRLLESTDVGEMSETELNEAWGSKDMLSKWYGSDLTPEEVIEEAHNRGIEVTNDD